jgi:UDP-2,3-diacylglucosamine pyrophosphatase LpxH
MKREIDIAILSDLHLGTFGCHAQEILSYLQSIEPEVLVLNGDIIDIWQFKKKYFPPAHIQVIREILKMSERGVKVHYITGNHDEALRRYSGTSLGNLSIDDKLVLEVDGKRVWIFHGDVFDATTKGWAKVLAKLGGKGYDLLILLNHVINQILLGMGKNRMSFSKKVKNGVKKAVAWIGDFEQTAAELAIQEGYDVVICGHIHQPQKRVVENQHGQVLYFNSGDWLENGSALEYENGEWNICYTPLEHKEKYQPSEPLLVPEVRTQEVSFWLQTLSA